MFLKINFISSSTSFTETTLYGQTLNQSENGTCLQTAKVSGVSKVLHADDPAHDKWVAENITRAIAAVQVRVFLRSHVCECGAIRSTRATINDIEIRYDPSDWWT